MSNHQGEPKVPDLPPRAALSFASYGLGFGGFALLIWVLYQIFICGCI